MRAWLPRLRSQKTAEPTWMEIQDLRRRLAAGETPLIVDVRGPDEFDGQLGHIDGARNLPLSELSDGIPDILKSGAAIVLVCLTDKRSSQAAAQLSEAGISSVTVLRGGMRAWHGGG